MNNILIAKQIINVAKEILSGYTFKPKDSELTIPGYDKPVLSSIKKTIKNYVSVLNHSNEKVCLVGKELNEKIQKIQMFEDETFKELNSLVKEIKEFLNKKNQEKASEEEFASLNEKFIDFTNKTVISYRKILGKYAAKDYEFNKKSLTTQKKNILENFANIVQPKTIIKQSLQQDGTNKKQIILKTQILNNISQLTQILNTMPSKLNILKKDIINQDRKSYGLNNKTGNIEIQTEGEYKIASVNIDANYEINPVENTLFKKLFVIYGQTLSKITNPEEIAQDTKNSIHFKIEIITNYFPKQINYFNTDTERYEVQAEADQAEITIKCAIGKDDTEMSNHISSQKFTYDCEQPE